MPLSPADLALALFTFCNTARVFAYVPQIVKIGRDQQGATAISYSTWTLFGLSHLSTVAYAVLVVNDWRMAAVFAANTLCCMFILGMTAWKRAVHKAAQVALAAGSLLPPAGPHSVGAGEHSSSQLIGVSRHSLGLRVVADKSGAA